MKVMFWVCAVLMVLVLLVAYAFDTSTPANPQAAAPAQSSTSAMDRALMGK